jgi:RNA polymerase sigma-32 factor
LIEAHLRYVVAIALGHRRYGLPMGDLIAEGSLGMVHALERFDASRGTRFVTYAAYWIRAYVLGHILRSWSLVGVGSGALRSKTFFKLRRERARIANLVGENDRADELLAQAMGLSVARVVSLRNRLEARDVSIDSNVTPDSGLTLADTLIAGGSNQEEAVGDGEFGARLHSAVGQAVSALDERERYIVQMRLMADSEEELSLAEIGRRLGVSRERARQLEARAIDKLKTRISGLGLTPDGLPSAA